METELYSLLVQDLRQLFSFTAAVRPEAMALALGKHPYSFILLFVAGCACWWPSNPFNL
jgi:hypothetical protein